MPNANIHIVFEKNMWAVRREGSKYAMSTHTTQQQAIDVGLASARSEKSKLVVFNRQGKIQDEHE